jgi:hypothetical protein
MVLFRQWGEFFRICVRGGQFNDSSDGEKLCVDNILRYLPGCGLFTTDDGYIGLCQPDRRPGDCICVVLGYKTLLLLRPLSGDGAYYQLFGECYVHGLMFGDGVLRVIPSSWRRKVVDIQEHEFTMWERDGVGTLEDPRLGRLPFEWRRRYLTADDKPVDDPFENDGTHTRLVLEDPKTGDWAWEDPRLTPEAFKARGVDIQEFFLV